MSGLSKGIRNLWNKTGEHFSGAARIFCAVDFVFSYLRLGATPTEYFMYEFYRKSPRERRTFLTRRDYTTTYERINSADTSVLVDKVKFNTRMVDFIGREWLFAGDGCTAADFAAFAKKHPSMIIKPYNALQGRGVWRLDITGDEDLEKLFEEKIKGSLVEERIIQHPALEKLAPGSVNCIRVITLNYGDRVDIVSCTLKTGGGKAPVDNLHAGGGVGGSVDIETGVFFTPAKPWEGEPTLFHPVSGEKIIGFQVPNWDIFQRRIRDAARAIPELPIIGWDCAITADDIAIVEGNHDPSPVLAQVFDQIGKRPVFREFIRNMK